jgi:Ca2+/Na+ antiporter
VLGVTSVIRPIPLQPGGHLDLLVVAVLSLILFLVSMTNDRKIVRTEACLLLVIYVAYITWRSSNALIS